MRRVSLGGMASIAGESEFGGVAGLIQPAPHVPTSAEQLSLIYRTGDPSGRTPADQGEIWGGLRTESAQRATMEAAGAFDKGQVAEELQAAADAALAALAAEAAPE